MRLWPRGVRRTHVDRWLRDLGADLADLRAYRAGEFAWPEMRRRYLAGLRRAPAAAALRDLGALLRPGPVTLLCACPDATRCHRGLLATRLARGGRPSTSRPPRRAPGVRPRRPGTTGLPG